MRFSVIFATTIISAADAFVNCKNWMKAHNDVSMKWTFSKSGYPSQDFGSGVGSQGELYYVPGRKAGLKGPPGALGQEINLPIFPRNQVLCPLGEDFIGVYEMRFRQLFYEIGENGYLGYLFYSPENQKFALVGTLARVKRVERLEDGGIFVLLEGVGRFFIKDIIGEKPYLKCKVQLFYDYTDKVDSLHDLESKLFDEVRYSVKLMQVLYPQTNFTINEASIRNRPLTETAGVRSVLIGNQTTEMARRSRFSFAAMDMLKADPIMKLVLLQEHVLEKRFTSLIKAVEESTAFLEGEVRKRKILGEDGIRELRVNATENISELLEQQLLQSQAKISTAVAANVNVNGWSQSPVYMD